MHCLFKDFNLLKELFLIVFFFNYVLFWENFYFIILYYIIFFKYIFLKKAQIKVINKCRSSSTHHESFYKK